jgi:hypothetical protein
MGDDVNQTAAVALGLLALVFLVALPFALLRWTTRQRDACHAAVGRWAVAQGLAPSAASAAGVHPQVQAVSFASPAGDVWSFVLQPTAGRAVFVAYLRPAGGIADEAAATEAARRARAASSSEIASIHVHEGVVVVSAQLRDPLDEAAWARVVAVAEAAAG